MGVRKVAHTGETGLSLIRMRHQNTKHASRVRRVAVEENSVGIMEKNYNYFREFGK